METKFRNTEKTKTNEQFVLKLSQILYLRKRNKHVALQNLFITRRKIQENSMRTVNLK